MSLRSIKEIYVIGHGPSSSHSMGPFSASNYIINKYKEKDIDHIAIYLYGSLALTGKGHLTDKMIDIALKDYHHRIIFDKKKKKKHPNTMTFVIYTKDKNRYKEDVISIGGGSILTKDNDHSSLNKEIYPHQHMDEISKYCIDNNISFYEYILRYEDQDIHEYFKNVLKVMDEAINRGLKEEGYLPGNLKVKRKAKAMYEAMNNISVDDVVMNVSIGAFAVAEENASGGIIVTAPTCGSAGVIPGCIRYLRMKNISDDKIIEGLMVAGLFGMVCKCNASVSGALMGCQAEIGVACSMAASMIAYCFDCGIVDIIQSAEIALEHSLGLTCDPVNGYVQIPCIERCALYAIKAIDAYKLALIIPNDDIHVSYDNSIKTMMMTGLDMNSKYKETAKGGLAKIIKK